MWFCVPKISSCHSWSDSEVFSGDGSGFLQPFREPGLHRKIHYDQRMLTRGSVAVPTGLLQLTILAKISIRSGFCWYVFEQRILWFIPFSPINLGKYPAPTPSIQIHLGSRWLYLWHSSNQYSLMDRYKMRIDLRNDTEVDGLAHAR